MGFRETSGKEVHLTLPTSRHREAVALADSMLLVWRTGLPRTLLLKDVPSPLIPVRPRFLVRTNPGLARYKSAGNARLGSVEPSR